MHLDGNVRCIYSTSTTWRNLRPGSQPTTESEIMRPTRLVAALAALGLALGLVSSATASAGPTPRLDRDDISAKQCMTNGAKQVVNVHYTLLNSADSGFAGNAWANDTILRHLRIWKHNDGTHCVQVADIGAFVTYAGASPSGTSTVPAGVRGIMNGGYITSDVVGVFAPTRPVRGYLGTFDMQCDQSFNCPGVRPSWPDYFDPGVTANEFAQWGWIYWAPRHGTWLNQDDVPAAQSGDIT